MTIVAVWYEPQDKLLWAVADTRISQRGQSGGVIVSTESGAKLLPLPVVCRVLGQDDGFLVAPYYTSNVGFVFAGSALAAGQTYLTAVTLLQNLATLGVKNPPVLKDIAELVRRLAERFCREVLSGAAGGHGTFEACIFAWCQHNKRYEIHTLKPDNDAGHFAIKMTSCVPRDEDDVVLLGSGAKEFRTRLAEIRKTGDATGRKLRAPKLAVEAMIREESVDDVGGSLSIGFCSEHNFNLCSWVSPKVMGQPAARRTLNGIDLDTEVGLVGDLIVAGVGVP